MANNLIDDLALEEIKRRLTAIEENQNEIIGHLQGVESMLGEIAQVKTSQTKVLRAEKPCSVPQIIYDEN